MEFKCVICKDTIKRKPSQVKDINKVYCNNCWGAWRKGKPSWNSGTRKRVNIKCVNCDNDFEVFTSLSKKAKYCSNKCYHKHTNHNRSQGKRWELTEETKIKQGFHQVGEKNHNWKGGYFRGKYIGIAQSKKFCKDVFKRDGYACQICGEVGRRAIINAHHLNSCNLFPKEVTDIDNGITLCQKHHREFHILYGYGNNTKQQFIEYILHNYCDEIEEIKVEEVKNKTLYNISLEGNESFFSNGILTHNTLPHVITPRNKKALAFGDVVVKKVNHPGSRPNNFIRRTLRRKLPGIITKNIERVLS